MTTVEQLKVIFSPEAVPFSFTKSHVIISAASVKRLGVAVEKLVGVKNSLPLPEID